MTSPHPHDPFRPVAAAAESEPPTPESPSAPESNRPRRRKGKAPATAEDELAAALADLDQKGSANDSAG